MSRIGKKPIQITEGVEVAVNGNFVTITGKLGTLQFPIAQDVSVKIEDGKIVIARKSESKQTKSDHGTLSSSLTNAVYGVSSGWTKTLELIGTGFRGRLEGESLVLAIGYSHPVKFDPSPGIKFSIEESKITISGIDRHQVGQIAANIRAVRPPDVYKGKGVKYVDEYVRRKPGKAAKTGATA